MAAYYFGYDRVQTYSGGTEATAFNPNAIKAIQKAGFEITTDGVLSNPHYTLNFNKENIEVDTFCGEGLALYRAANDGSNKLLCLFNFSEKELPYPVPEQIINAKKILDSKEGQWMTTEGNATLSHPKNAATTINLLPLSVVVYHRE